MTLALLKLQPTLGNSAGRSLIFCIFFMFASPMRSAADESSATELDWKNNWSSPSSRGLGGSQTAHAINEDAVFANPAALARVRNPRSRKTLGDIEAPKISLGGNSNLLSALKGKGLQPSSWIKIFASLSAQDRNYMEIQALPWLVLGERRGPTYFLGLPMRSTLTAYPSTNDGTSRRISTQTTAMAAMNATLSSRSGSLSLGVTLRPNMRWNTQNELNLIDIVSSKTLLSDLKKSAHKTTSTAIDLGLSITAGDYWLPTFGLSILNLPTGCVDNFMNPSTGKTQSICGAKRTGSVQEDIPGSRIDPTEVRAGLSIIPRFRLGQYRINMKISGDVYPLPIKSGNKNFGFADVNINQLTHAGLELFTGNALSSRNPSIRAGMNETRSSLGVYLPFPHFSFEASVYEAALFTNGKAGKERRYLIGLSSDW